MSGTLADEILGMIDQAQRQAAPVGAADRLHVTTMRLPSRTIRIIDAHRGTMNRTRFIIHLVDRIESASFGVENARCSDEIDTCERGT
jgi:hypothetical protein